MPTLRKNSKLRARLGGAGLGFLDHAAGAIQRLLPHVQISGWKEGDWKAPGGTWVTNERVGVRVTIAIGKQSEAGSRSLVTTVTRRRVPALGSAASETMDNREHSICGLIANRISQVLTRTPTNVNETASIAAIRDAFDEHVVAEHVRIHHDLALPIASVLSALHTLSEQSYENKALTFGCILDPSDSAEPVGTVFPADFLESKKYKALSDGFRTAYLISSKGRIVDFVDLERYGRDDLTERHYFPDWTESMARVSRSGRCGISLSRQGDVLIFDEGTLRFTYRYGQWQYWNHAHLVNLLRDRGRAQRVPKNVLGRVVNAIYRAALDISFRRSGGLFVVLHNQKDLHKIVRKGDALSDADRPISDSSFDDVVESKTIQTLARSVLVELASLDGAVVLQNSGKLVAYGAVLQPKRSGVLHGTEGSRTKAAIGASHYGLAVKISSDGAISVYHDGREFIRV